MDLGELFDQVFLRFLVNFFMGSFWMEISTKYLYEARQKIFEKILGDADKGDLEAWNDVGFIMHVFFKDHKAAYDAFKYTADLGNKRGKLGLALFLYRGMGVEKHYQKSYEYFVSLVDDYPEIKDLCTVWAAFVFPKCFPKEIRSVHKCKKGARFVKDQILRHIPNKLND